MPVQINEPELEKTIDEKRMALQFQPDKKNLVLAILRRAMAMSPVALQKWLGENGQAKKAG
jgi:hypothetical protein